MTSKCPVDTTRDLTGPHHLPTPIVTKYVEPSEIGVEAASVDIASSDGDPYGMTVLVYGWLKGSHYKSRNRIQ